jgi:tetratricopeptide (TPR) repeat protein
MKKIFWKNHSLEFFNENFDKALKLSNDLNEIAPSYMWGIKDRLLIYLYIPGHNDEALSLSKKFIEQIPNYPHLGTLYDFADWIGYFFWQAGNYKEARYYFDKKIKYCETKIKLAKDFDAFSHYALATVYAFLGDNIKAYQYLDKVDKSGYFDLFCIIDAKHGPWFARLHNEPRFQKIIQNMESRYQAEHERVRKWLEEQGKL